MHIDHFFFRLYRVPKAGAEEFLGSAFPVTDDGGLLTCRHVTDGAPNPGELAVHDNITGWKIHIREIRTSSRLNVDLAFLPGALKGGSRSFFPILPPRHALVGTEVHSYGFFATGGRLATIEQGYFSGRVVNLLKTQGDPPLWYMTLPYPVIEGMSGSAVLTYRNGPKLAGVAFGNQSSRILASEILDYEDQDVRLRETIHRIVEFGRAYHSDTVLRFLEDVGATGYRVTDDVVPMPGLVPPPGVA